MLLHPYVGWEVVLRAFAAVPALPCWQRWIYAFGAKRSEQWNSTVRERLQRPHQPRPIHHQNYDKQPESFRSRERYNMAHAYNQTSRSVKLAAIATHP